MFWVMAVVVATQLNAFAKTDPTVHSRSYKPGTEMALSGKDPWGTLMRTGRHPRGI